MTTLPFKSNFVVEVRSNPMIGKYRLLEPTRAVHQSENGGFLLLPKDAVIRVEGFDDTGQLAQARWGSRPVLVFPQDVEARGVKIAE